MPPPEISHARQPQSPQKQHREAGRIRPFAHAAPGRLHAHVRTGNMSYTSYRPLV
jgi:hypothetical protein